jgi:DNA-binding transcriptional LysR family regulator
MTVKCDVILQWNATPDQLAALGAALCRWCRRTAGGAGVYPYLDDQALADLIAGKLPATVPTPRRPDQRGVCLSVRSEVSQDRQATIASLRQVIPAEGVEDILVDGKSWNRLG